MQIDRKTAHSLYRRMLKIRLTEEAIAERYSEWKMRCPTHLSIGQEGVAAGVCENLRDTDFVLSTHRAHAHYLAKGGDLERMIAEIYGKASGCNSGKGGSMHLIDKAVGFMGSTSIVGNTIPLAVGLGLSISLQKTDQISTVFFGDAAVEEGVLYESINFAVLKNLPVLFICENNLYSVYSPLSVRQPAGRKIHESLAGLGIKTGAGDGNNVVEVFQKVNLATERIRSGQGPEFLEFATYRWREHCGPNYDNDLGYRTEEEFAVWRERDPLAQMKRELWQSNYAGEGDFARWWEQARVEIDRAFEQAEAAPFPDQSVAFENLYAGEEVVK
ncbi:MAG: thiamine pyrophosphate-dependent dehydrogenase E1 component subunit alpha [Candidatus Neomarinimicrobiota bacterium]